MVIIDRREFKDEQYKQVFSEVLLPYIANEPVNKYISSDLTRWKAALTVMSLGDTVELRYGVPILPCDDEYCRVFPMSTPGDILQASSHETIFIRAEGLAIPRRLIEPRI